MKVEVVERWERCKTYSTDLELKCCLCPVCHWNDGIVICELSLIGKMKFWKDQAYTMGVKNCFCLDCGLCFDWEKGSERGYELW